MRTNISAQREYCIEIHLKDLIPVLIWELVCWMSSLDTAAVEQDMYVVAICYNPGDQSFNRLSRGKVCNVYLSLAAKLLNGLFRFLVGLIPLSLGQH